MSTSNPGQHRTVLLREAVAALAITPDGRYVDASFGRGGHSRAILAVLGPAGRLLGLDQDPQAVAAGEALAAQDGRFIIVKRRFGQLASEVTAQGWQGQVNGVLFDLGVSSPQLDQAERGFSFLHDGHMDMRMAPTQGQSAAQWLASASEAEIADVFHELGEERFARRMAKAVVVRRQQQPFERTADLAEVIKQANPAWEKGKHPATRAFQALRIKVNDELGELTAALDAAIDQLAVGGRLVVISFHSLEDRIVKRFMHRLAKGEADNLPRDLPVRQAAFVPRLRLVGKPQFPGEAELADNPRARSAVMRVAEKLA